MKNKEILFTAEDLLVRFLKENGRKPQESKRFRSDFRKVCLQLGAENLEELTVESLPTTREAVESRAMGGGVSAPTLSRYLKIVEWAIEAGLINPAPDAAVKLGFPEFLRREMTRDWRWAEAVWETVTRYAVARRVKFEKADADFWAAAFDRHIGSRSAGRAEVSCFIRVWNQEAEVGRAPVIKFPSLSSRKPQSYRLDENLWPANLQSGLRSIRSWLEDSLVKGRGTRQKQRKVSVDQQINNLLRYGGFLANVEGEDLTALSWDDLLTAERVLRFIFFTDPQAEEKRNGHRYSSGVHQESHLNTFIDFCRGPLQLPDRARELENLRAQFIFEKKRAPIGADLCPNDFFRCSRLMVEKARKEEEAGHLITASTLRRDALLIALNTLFPRRVDLWDRLKIGKHVVVPAVGPPSLNLWREESKPGKADQVLEIPEELIPLLRHYLEVDRPRLIGEAEDHGFFFVGQGGGAVKKGTPRAVFRARVQEFLRVNLGSHALRKIWAPRYLDYSNGDYMTVMAVLDTSMNNILNAYRDGQDRSQAKQFVQTADRLWVEINNQGGPHHEQPA